MAMACERFGPPTPLVPDLQSCFVVSLSTLSN
jgi:hypothetical protein